jgi:transcriptional regulator with XRE-family HTH domain
MPSMQEVASLLVQGRQNLQLSQRALAQEVGTTATKLCAWETCQRRIKLPRDEMLLKKLGELFKCDWHLFVPDPPARPEQFVQSQPYFKEISLVQGQPLEHKEEVDDIAMLTPFAIALHMKCFVSVENRTFKSGDFVKVRNTLNDTIFFRQITNEGGMFFLRPINPAYQTFAYEPSRHEILGVVTDICYTLNR